MTGTLQRLTAAAFVSLLAALPLAAEDSVRMKNGAVFAGKIVDETESVVLIKTASGTMTLSKSDIKSIKREKEQLRPAASPPGPAGTPAPPPAAGRTSQPPHAPPAPPAASALRDRANERLGAVDFDEICRQTEAKAAESAPGMPLVAMTVVVDLTREGKPLHVQSIYLADAAAQNGYAVSVTGPGLERIKAGPVQLAIPGMTPRPIADIRVSPADAARKGIDAFLRAGGDPDLEVQGKLALAHWKLPAQAGRGDVPRLCWQISLGESTVYLDGESGEALHVAVAGTHRRSAVAAPTAASPAGSPLLARARSRHAGLTLGPSLDKAAGAAGRELPNGALLTLAVKPLMFKTLDPGATPVSMLFTFYDRSDDNYVSIAVGGPGLDRVTVMPKAVPGSTKIPITKNFLEPGDALIKGLEAFEAAGGDPDADTGVVLGLEFRDLSEKTGGSSKPVLSWFMAVSIDGKLSRIYLDGATGETLQVELAPEHRRSVMAPAASPPPPTSSAPAAPPTAGDALPALRPLFDRAKAIAEDWSAGVTAIGIEAHPDETPQGPAVSFTYYFKKRGPAETGFLYGVLGRTDKPDEMKGNHFSGQVAFIPSHNEIYPFQMADVESKEWIDVDEAVRIARKAAAPAGGEARPAVIGAMFLGHRSRPGKSKDAVALCWVVEVDRTLVCLSALTGEVLHVQEPEPRQKSK